MKVRLRPYELLLVGDRWNRTTQEIADRTIDVGWEVAPDRAVPLHPPVKWDESPAGIRFLVHLHSWGPLGPVLSGFDHTRKARYLRYALQVALDWIQQHPGLDATAPLDGCDMAVGPRAWRLGYLTDAAARAPFCSDQIVGELLDAVRLHLDALAHEARFPHDASQGFYFAAGQAALATRFPELPGMDEAGRRAQERLRDLLASRFTSEGVLREHSPGYHWMLLRTVEELRASGLLSGQEHVRRLHQLQEAMAWFILPNGCLANFGDTARECVTEGEPPHLRSNALRCVLTQGREGNPPRHVMKGFPASGYVVFRDGWPNGKEVAPDGSYLAQACAFHSSTHKHADDLTFIWYDRGQEILVDPGGYGPGSGTPPHSLLREDGSWYADPKRIYVESTRAHNTVGIDDRNLPRRQMRPYQSALMRWGEMEGVFFAESAVRYWESICHRRVLLLHPGRWLLVFDWLLDEESEPHRFVQRFHFAPELEAEMDADNGLRLTLPGQSEPLRMVSLAPGELVDPVRGQRDPEPLGWVSTSQGKMAPCWTSGFASPHCPRHVFGTLFAFGDDPPRSVAAPELVATAENRFLARWAQGEQIHAVSFRSPVHGRATLGYGIGTLEPGIEDDPG